MSSLPQPFHSWAPFPSLQPNTTSSGVGPRIVSFALGRYSRYCPATNPGFNSGNHDVNTSTQMQACGASGKAEPYAWSHLSAPHSLVLTLTLDCTATQGKTSNPQRNTLLLLELMAENNDSQLFLGTISSRNRFRACPEQRSFIATDSSML